MAATLLAVAWCSTANADVIYRETFPALSSSTNATTVGWRCWISFDTTGAGGNVQDKTTLQNIISPSPTTYSPNTNGVNNWYEGQTANTATYGRIALSASSSRWWLNSTVEYGPIAQSDALVFSWAQGSTRNTDTRLAIEVGGNWYVSAAVENFISSTDWAERSVAFADASWWQLNSGTLGSGGTFDIAGLSGDSVALPTGNITSFGLFAATSDGVSTTSRYDDFTIVPEPATLSLLMIGAGISFLCRRR
ncbi:MAG: PEP-CTERM sorting domain-containing protein [Kiritimatiellales bacterium]